MIHNMFLSKSQYCSAIQCPKMLWLKKNKPEAFDESVLNQAVLETGNEVGDLPGGRGAADGIAEFVVGHEAYTEGFCEFDGHTEILSMGVLNDRSFEIQ